jgi:cyclohexyl-isocyanide hydratase
MKKELQIGFILFHNVTQLDLTGPAQVLSRLPEARIHLISEQLYPVITDVGFSINPTITYKDCPQLDVICVPGSATIGDHLANTSMLKFINAQCSDAKFITSVCNGSLILGAAGVLQGRRSACHWIWRKYLPLFGAIEAKDRVVVDGRYISGGGVTAGIDFAYVLASLIAGEDVAKRLQLALEYDPKPPYDCGTPEKAPVELVNLVLELQKDRIEKAEQLIKLAAGRLKIS